MQPDLFPADRSASTLAPGAVVLGGYAIGDAAALLAAIGRIAVSVAFRHLVTPGGRRMSVAMTNCGPLGWVSDASGYRYAAHDPQTGQAWPAMPDLFAEIARSAARTAGFASFVPDACLINRYEPGARLALHQDRDEHDHDAPIVSVSLGVPARFLWGGDARRDAVRRLTLGHGDVVVWGGPSRMAHHGIAPIAAGTHPETGPLRYNLTFRRAGG